MRFSALVFGLFCLVAGSPSSHALEIYRTGNPKDAVRPSDQVTCLGGGGDDSGWAGGWRAMLRASGGGDIVIIRADGRRGGYEDWIYKDNENNKFPKVNSVTTVLLERSQDADDLALTEVIRNAEMVFFAGGNQSLYISWFRHSVLEKEVSKAVKQRHIPIGGTSAGMALLAGIDFRARLNSPTVDGGMITSEDALMDPTAAYMDMDNHVLNGFELDQVVTDTHFSQRGRHGRLVGFLAKAIYAHFSSVERIHGIASDEETAYCYDHSGLGRGYGKGQVYFVKALSAPEILEENRPLTWDNQGRAIEAIMMSEGTDLFHVGRWEVRHAENDASGKTKKEYWSVINGALSRNFTE